MKPADVAVIGGGIVGLATAYQLTREHPGCRVVVLEKEADLAHHQTGHNSGVLHSGIYYKPGSLKAINCRAGKKAMEEFCAAEGISYEICGKVIVAVDDTELPALERIYERGQANGVNCTMIDKYRLAELEPYAAGVRAIHVPETGIVNYRQVCLRLAERVRERDGEVLTSTRVTGMKMNASSVVLTTTVCDLEASQVVTCAGLQCDRVTAMSGDKMGAKIIPFRGEYFALKPEVHHFCKNLIYPVPDPNFPFLGVHFTRMIDGSVECGPNAVLAMAREGLPQDGHQHRRPGRIAHLPGLPQAGSQILEDGPGRNVAVDQQGRVCESASAPAAGDHGRTPRARAGGRAGTGGLARRRLGRRLPHQGERPRDQHRQHPVTSRDGVA